jgi:hypothetical protein
MTDTQWMTYREAAAKFGCTTEAIRRRASRGRWGRRAGNDGAARICVPDDVQIAPAGRPEDARRTSGEDSPNVVHALRDHIATLRDQLEQARAEFISAQERAAGREADHAAQLAQRDEQLAEAHAAADLATTKLVALAQRFATIAEERSTKPEATPEPPRRSAMGRAWKWFLRN